MAEAGPKTVKFMASDRRPSRLLAC